ncbi:MAG: trypsin-like peptidase domain-containing protein [Myxococcota bacterium]
MNTTRLRRLAAWGLAVLVLSPAAYADRARRRDAVVEVVEKVSPAVVYIGTVQMVERPFRSIDPFFDELFGGHRGRRRAVEGLGSGVIIDPSGIIVTNDHVIRGATEIHVVLADGRQLDADVIGSDADNDLAVLKVNAKTPLPAATLGTSGDLMIGETVVAIGSPFGLKKTVTAGVVSTLGRSFQAQGQTYNDFVQTDASINPGNSGGPLLNIDGEVIGINTAIFASAQGIGFAIPADKVRRIVTELAQHGKVRPAWVGIISQPLTQELAAGLGWDKSYGALVTAVEANSPAATAGVRPGDIVATVDGTQVENAEDLEVRLRGYPAHTSIALELFRRGTRLELRFDAVEFPPQLAERLAWERLGLRLQPGRGGLTISAVRPGSPAAQIGLAGGDVVLKLNNHPMSNPESFREVLLAARRSRSVVLLVRRGRTGYHLTLPF